MENSKEPRKRLKAKVRKVTNPAIQKLRQKHLKPLKPLKKDRKLEILKKMQVAQAELIKRNFALTKMSEKVCQLVTKYEGSRKHSSSMSKEVQEVMKEEIGRRKQTEKRRRFIRAYELSLFCRAIKKATAEIAPMEEDYTVEEIAMSNPWIAKRVFKHLEVPDLLKMRCVNRIWNKNASLVLREENKCTAQFFLLDKDRKPNAFHKLMSKNNEAIPFSGCSMKVSNPKVDEPHVPFKAGPLRFLDLDLRYVPEPEVPSTIKILQETFDACCPTLEELTLTSLPEAVQRFYDLLPPKNGLVILDNKLPKLKKIILPKRHNEGSTNAKVLRDVLRAAPNLEELEGDITPALTKSVVQTGKGHLVKSFRFSTLDPADITWTLRFVTPEPPPPIIKLRLEVCLFRQMQFMFQNLRGLMAKLVEISQKSLEFLDITELCFLKFFAEGTMKMETLRRLSIRYDPSLGRVPYSLLARINLKDCFPVLNLIILVLDQLYTDEAHALFLPEFQEVGEQMECRTVRKLKIIGKQATGNLMQQLAKVFPKVIELHLAHTRDYIDIFASLWTAWPRIRYIQADLKDQYLTKSLDSVFTGFSDEVIEEFTKTHRTHSFSAFERDKSIMNLTKLRRISLDLFRSADSKFNKGRPLRHALQPFLHEVTFRCTIDLIPTLRFQANFNTYEQKTVYYMVPVPPTDPLPAAAPIPT